MRLLLLLSLLAGAGCSGCKTDGVVLGRQLGVLQAGFVSATPSSVTVAWAPYEGAVSYRIHRDGSEVGLTVRSASQWTDPYVESDQEYAYIVEAIGEGWFLYGVPIARSTEFTARTPPPAPWLREDVAASRTGLRPAVVVDAADAAHVLYCLAPGLEVRHATERAGGWVDEKLTDGCWAAMTLDPGGRPQAIYVDPDKALRHATLDGSWSFGPVDPGPLDLNAEMDLTADHSGALHAVYVINDVGLWYATNAGGAWQSEPVLDNMRVWDVAIAVEPGGAAHILYLDREDPLGLWHLTNASGAWESEEVKTWMVSSVDCAFDAAGTLHAVGYHAPPNGPRLLLHLTRDAAIWTDETIEDFGSSSGDISLALDGAGALHVAYEGHQSDLMYATNADGEWSTVFVDADGRVGDRNTLALDGTGRVHIVYLDGTRGVFRRARSP